MPHGLSLEEATELRQRDPQEFARRSSASMARHVQAMLEFHETRRDCV
ncbi:MAG: hypothetical protein U0559_08595 [Anaerolineae bacterium]